jgi:hypothetical protein
VLHVLVVCVDLGMLLRLQPGYLAKFKKIRCCLIFYSMPQSSILYGHSGIYLHVLCLLFAKFKEETLFYIFYSMPQVRSQSMLTQQVAAYLVLFYFMLKRKHSSISFLVSAAAAAAAAVTTGRGAADCY